jgi:hypothetical protein
MLKLFTLTTGLEIIGKLTDNNTDPLHFNIEHPLGIHTQATGPDTYGLAFVPFSAANPEGVQRFHRKAILAEHLVIPAEIEKAYVKYTSKIQLL